MPIDTRRTRPRRFSTWVLGAGLALSVGVAACTDPNPTFVFDSGADGSKDATTDGAGATDGSGKGGGGGGAAGASGGGTGGAGGGAAGTGETGGAAAGGASGAGGAA